MRSILVTSALPYANGPIHLGHLVEYIQTDIWVRYHKLRGHDCLYLCADDTHGTPVMIRAQREGITPEALVAAMHTQHLADFTDFHVGFDNYYTTNSEENRLLAEEVYNTNLAGGHIARRPIRQSYCTKDAMFLPDRYIRGTCPSCGALDQYGDACESCSATYSPVDLKDGRCALCGTPPEERESEHYFFKLGDFEAFLREWTRSGALQEEMANKLDEWFRDGLKDWDISRDGPYFGFQIPNAPGKFFYVWLDAPIGYMASTWNYCQRTGRDFDSYWRQTESEVYHFIGKDILYFHTLFWPAMLKGAGFRTPTRVFAHGFLTVNGHKMSKSRGTFIKARDYLDLLDAEALRYYYAYKLSNKVEDLDLNLDDFCQRVNSDVVGKVVNLASRTAGFVNSHFAGMLAIPYPEDGGLYHDFVQAGDEIGAFYESREYGRAMQTIMRLTERANQFVESRAPWVLARDETRRDELLAACSVALNLFRVLMTYLQPVLPRMARQVETFLDLPRGLSWEERQHPLVGHHIQAFVHLMQRVDLKKVAQLVERSKADASLSPSPSPPPPATPPVDPLAATVDIETFAKVDLRVARIDGAEAVAGADKLLKLTLNLGELGSRTVFAGIKQAYDPTRLTGRLTVVVANLQPRKMKFGLSEGMVLAAGPGGQELFLLAPDSGAQPGMKIK